MSDFAVGFSRYQQCITRRGRRPRNKNKKKKSLFEKAPNCLFSGIIDMAAKPQIDIASSPFAAPLRHWKQITKKQKMSLPLERSSSLPSTTRIIEECELDLSDPFDITGFRPIATGK